MTTNFSCSRLHKPLSLRPSSWTSNSFESQFSSTSNKFDVIQVDLYFIKEVAHNLQEYDLENKIDLEIKMREGTTKLLAACKHHMQSLEAAKSLVTSNGRMAAYMSELQRRKVKNLNSGQVSASNSRVSVSDIRIPLIWKDHFKNKGTNKKFAIFCLVKIGTEIFDTSLIKNVDRNMTDITFDDVIIFNEVSANFEFQLEVYSHIILDGMSIASTSSQIKKKISSSLSRTIGRKLAVSVKEEMNIVDIAPQFELVAHVTLRLSDSSDVIKTHDLMLETVDNPQHQLPFFGQLCCRLAVQPTFITDETFSGFLYQADSINGYRRLWCTLKRLKLSFWLKPGDSHCTSPILCIPVNKDTMLLTGVSSCTYPYSFILVNVVHGKTQEYIVAAETQQDCIQWIEAIRQHARNHETWGVKAEYPMEIPSPGSSKIPGFFRQGSLYEQTPISESDDPSNKSDVC
ncbi:rhotekin-2-like isoform X2 [Tachypleus tridentatus]|uniref:rhotekin-2-like isoform X2 n=1 Tax=Tachypleus tridentatus TaxID=6853 RepID=UPI003FD08510